jgi:hypothetical protein
MPISGLFSGGRTGSVAALTVALLALQTASPAPALGAWGNGWHDGGRPGAPGGWHGAAWHSNAGFGGWHGGWTGWHGGSGGWHAGWGGFRGGWGWRAGYGWSGGYGWRAGWGWPGWGRRAGWANYAPGWGSVYAPGYGGVAPVYAVRPIPFAPAVYAPPLRHVGYFHHVVHHVVSVCR